MYCSQHVLALSRKHAKPFDEPRYAKCVRQVAKVKQQHGIGFALVKVSGRMSYILTLGNMLPQKGFQIW